MSFVPFINDVVVDDVVSMPVTFVDVSDDDDVYDEDVDVDDVVSMPVTFVDVSDDDVYDDDALNEDGQRLCEGRCPHKVEYSVPVTFVDVSDNDDYDDVYDEDVDDSDYDDYDELNEESFVVEDGQSLCLCEGRCPHKVEYSVPVPIAVDVDDDVFVNPDRLWSSLQSSPLYSLTVLNNLTDSREAEMIPRQVVYSITGHVMNTSPIR